MAGYNGYTYSTQVREAARLLSTVASTAPNSAKAIGEAADTLDAVLAQVQILVHALASRAETLGLADEDSELHSAVDHVINADRRLVDARHRLLMGAELLRAAPGEDDTPPTKVDQDIVNRFMDRIGAPEGDRIDQLHTLLASLGRSAPEELARLRALLDHA